MVLLGERLGIEKIVGGAVILLGVYLARRHHCHLLSNPAPTSRDQPVDEQKHDRPQGGHHDGPYVEARRPRATEDADQDAAHHRSCHTDEGRYDEASRVISWHQNLRQKPCDEADHYPAYDANRLPSFSLLLAYTLLLGRFLSIRSATRG